jgi:mRNA interferase MazF
MKRGEIWWAKLAPPAGLRPVLLLSRDETYTVRSLVLIAPITTRIRHVPSEVLLGNSDGMPRECAANLDSITIIPKNFLREHLVSLNSQKLKEVENALRFVLDLE